MSIGPRESFYDISRKGAPPLRVARDLQTGGLWLSDHTMGVWFHAEDVGRIIRAVIGLYPELHRAMVADDEIPLGEAHE